MFINKEILHFHFCCGLGGGAKGFARAQPRVGNMKGAIAAAIDQTLEKHGLSTEFQITHENSAQNQASQQQLSLIAA